MKKTILIGVLLFFAPIAYSAQDIQNLSRQLSLLHDSRSQIKPSLTPVQINRMIKEFSKLRPEQINQEIISNYLYALGSLRDLVKQLLREKLNTSIGTQMFVPLKILGNKFDQLKMNNMTPNEKNQIDKLQKEINNDLEQYDQQMIEFEAGRKYIDGIIRQNYYTLEPIEQELDKIKKSNEPLHPELTELFQQALEHLKSEIIRYGTALLEKKYEPSQSAEYIRLHKILNELIKISEQESGLQISDLIKYQFPLQELDKDIKIHKLQGEELNINQAHDLLSKANQAVKNRTSIYDLTRAQLEKIQQTIIKEGNRAIDQNLDQIAVLVVSLVDEFTRFDYKNYFTKDEFYKLVQPLGDVSDSLKKIIKIEDVSSHLTKVESAVAELKKARNAKIKSQELVSELTSSKADNATIADAIKAQEKSEQVFEKQLANTTESLLINLDAAIEKLRVQKKPTQQEIQQGFEIYNFISQLRAFLGEFTNDERNLYKQYIDRLNKLIDPGEQTLEPFVKLAQAQEEAEKKELHERMAKELKAVPIYTEIGRKRILQNPLAVLGLAPKNNETEAAIAQAGRDPKAGNTEDAIKAAYRKLSLKWHPNRPHEDKKLAEEIFKVLQAAYERLIRS